MYIISYCQCLSLMMTLSSGGQNPLPQAHPQVLDSAIKIAKFVADDFNSQVR